MPDTSKSIGRQVFEAWNAHDADAYAALLDPNHTIEGDTIPGGRAVGRDAAREYMQVYVNAFPDLHFEIEREFAAGDYTVVCWKSSGTHRGPLPGIPATGRSGSVRGCNVLRIGNGRITQAWTYWDGATLLRNLGVLPEFASTSGTTR